MNQNNNHNHNYKGPHYSFNAYIKNKEDKQKAKIAEEELEKFVGYKETNNKSSDAGKNKRNDKEKMIGCGCGIF